LRNTVRRQQEGVHRGPDPHQQQRRAQVGDHQVLAHVGHQQVLAQRVDRRQERDRDERDARVPGHLLAHRRLVAAPAEHPDGADVQPLGHHQGRDHPRVEDEAHDPDCAGSWGTALGLR
jgi:hypothetical protein